MTSTPAPDLAARLRELADHIDRHDLPDVRISLGPEGFAQLSASCQRTVTDWAVSFDGAVRRSAVVDTPVPFIGYSAHGQVGGNRVRILFADYTEAETLRACDCNWRNLCDRCADSSTVDEVALLRGVAA